MRIEGQSLEEVFFNVVLEVPFFQRSYVWKKDNWEELLNDLFNMEITHFLGSIILKEQDNNSCKLKKYLIVDGQQRLTTLSILAKALYDCMENEQDNIFDSIKNILFCKEVPSDSEYKFVLNHSHNDEFHFRDVIGKIEHGKIVSNIKDELENIKTNDMGQTKLIKKCYKYFYEELSRRYKKNVNDVISLCNKLFKANDIMAVIFLEKDDGEQKIFDSINTAGIRLSATEIIKNAIYQKLIELNGNRDEIISYYEKTWKNIFESDEETIDYWCTEKISGNLKLQNSELLLRHVGIIKDIYDPSSNRTSQLSEMYKLYLANKNQEELKMLIKEIIQYAQIYRKHFSDLEEIEIYEFDDKNVKLRLFKILSIHKIIVYNPYILFLLKKYDDDKERLNAKLINLEKLVIKSLILGGVSAAANKQIKEILDNDDLIIKKYSDEINRETIRNSLKTKVHSNTAKTLLFWIELHRKTQDKNYDSINLPYRKYQLEHIMPIKWEEHWSNVKCVDDDNKVLHNSEKAKQRRVEKITSLGNMTLLSSSLNNALKNSSFKKKIEGDGEKKGLKEYASLSITQKDIIENVYNKGKEWNEAEITKREKALADEIIDIWG